MLLVQVDLKLMIEFQTFDFWYRYTKYLFTRTHFMIFVMPHCALQASYLLGLSKSFHAYKHFRP